MSGDMANAELGISQVDNKAAQNRLSQADGLQKQQQWNSNQLNERTMGFAILFCVSLVVSVWAFDVPNILRYSVTGLVALVGLAWATIAKHKKDSLAALRDQQMRDHRSG